MFYSKYSDYTHEQVLTDKYKQHCEKLLSMATSEQVQEKMKRNIIRRWIW